MSVTDIAVAILKSRGKPVHFKELIAEVMRVKAIAQENSGRLIAQMHTEISLDSRFIHHGSGEWGLREWQNKGNKVVRIRPETPSVPVRSRPRLRDDVEDEEELEEGYSGNDDSDTDSEAEDEALADDLFGDESDEEEDLEEE